MHTFIQSCLFFLHISPLFISPLFLYLPRTLGLSFYTLSHPCTTGHAPSPVTRLQLIRAAGANLHQNGFTCILVHLRSTQDVCVLYEEVRCKSYDLAAVPGAFGTAATPAPHRGGSHLQCEQRRQDWEGEGGILVLLDQGIGKPCLQYATLSPKQ